MAKAKDQGDTEGTCPACAHKIFRYQPLNLPKNVNPVASKAPSQAQNGPGSKSTGDRKRRKKGERLVGDDILNSQPRMNGASSWLDEFGANSSEPLTPSASTVAIKNQVLKWQREAPDDKIISELNGPARFA